MCCSSIKPIQLLEFSMLWDLQKMCRYHFQLFVNVSLLALIFQSVLSCDICDNVRAAVDLSHSLDFDIVHPYISDALERRPRDINSNVYYEEENKLKIVELGDWILQLDISNDLLAPPQLVGEWSSGESTTVKRDLAQCDYKHGVVRGLAKTSTVAMTFCGSEITGFLLLPDAAYFIQPFDRSNGSHILYKSEAFKSLLRVKRTASVVNKLNEPSSKQWEFFNLTGDIIEIDDEGESPQDQGDVSDNLDVSENLPARNNTPKWWREELSSDELGYFLDTAWEVDFSRGYGRGTITRGRNSPTRWLEIAIAVDYTVIAFHGRDRVEQYVLALMNIVSAIYQDSSLEANMQLVVSRLLLFENKKQSVVKPGNAKKSLENVNGWNRRLHVSLSPGETHHDVAVWLTRSDIGGPSGYAPVGGVCDQKRSCALNRDEGLTSAFIIAHEMAHILGLSHDGDKKSGNDCGDEATEGSVMAPMVAATFHKFIWSQCSKNELKSKLSQWTCLQNAPPGMDEIILNATIDSTFSMDEQCRMEFGEGFQLCRAFDIIEPCSHLWCGHVKSPLVCKTKKGPPLEGTECGFDKWCINGYCEPVSKLRFGVAPVLHNPQDGGWSEWSRWGACSRSCGIGAKFRSRRCDNPAPTYGGLNCFGAAEEWEICNTQACPEPILDTRAQQCLNIVGFLKIQDRRANMTWLPYESDHVEMKCQLICMSKETRELFVTGENLIDGTPCSYENANDICLQGTCQPLGCDAKLHSVAKEDACGICKGNNSECSKIISVFRKRIRKEVSRVAVIPKMSRNILVDTNLTLSFSNTPTAAFILKNRMKKKYDIPIPSSGVHAEIIEGTKIYYKKNKNNHRIWAKGPILEELVLLLYAPRSEVNMGLNVSLSFQYYIKKSSLNATMRYSWVLGGWGPCSASCGGGRRQKTIACWDEDNKKIVRRKFCSIARKPPLPTEVCNNYSCHFNWITGPWEPCSSTCGSYGTQSRELYCIPQAIINNRTKVKEPWKFMVSPNKCAGLKPFSSRPCYRIPCPSYWEYGEWSQCSASCGSGVSTRSTHCPPPEGESFYTCGVHPVIQRKVCRGSFNKRNNALCKGGRKKRCTGDKSNYCGLPMLSKYCKLGSFRRLCCKSCSTFVLFPFSA